MIYWVYSMRERRCLHETQFGTKTGMDVCCSYIRTYMFACFCSSRFCKPHKQQRRCSAAYAHSHGWYVVNAVCPALSMIFSFLTLKSKSALPAAFAHQSYNLYLGVSSLVLIKDAQISPFNTTALILLLVGIVCTGFLRKDEKKGLLNVAAEAIEAPKE